MDGTGGASTDSAHIEEDGAITTAFVAATGSAAATGDGGDAGGDAFDADFGSFAFVPPDRAAPGEEGASPFPAPAESAAAAGESGGSGGIPPDVVAGDAGEMGDVGGPPPAPSGSNDEHGSTTVEPQGDIGGAGSERQTSSDTPTAMSPAQLWPSSPLADGSGGSGGGSGGSGGNNGHVGRGFTGGSSATPPPGDAAFEGAGLGPGGTFGQREPALFGDVGGDGGMDSMARVDSEDPVSVHPLRAPLEDGPAATLAAGSGGSGGGWASPAFEAGRGDLGGFADFDSPAVAASSGTTDGAQHLAAELGEEGSGGSGGGNVVTPHGGHGGSGEPMTMDGGDELLASAAFASTASASTAVPLVSSSTGNSEDVGAAEVAAIASAAASSGEPRSGVEAAPSPAASVDDPGATPGSVPVAFNPTGGSGSDDPGGTPACAEVNAAIEPQDSAGTTAVDASAMMVATAVAEVVCDDDPGSTPSLEHGDSGGLFGGSQAADSGSGVGPSPTANNDDASTAVALGAIAADDSGDDGNMLQVINSDLSGTGAAGSPTANSEGVSSEAGVASAFDTFAAADANLVVDSCDQANSPAGPPLATNAENSAGDDSGFAKFTESTSELPTAAATTGAGFAFDDEDEEDDAGFASFGASAPAAATEEVTEPRAEVELEREQAEELDTPAAISNSGFAFDEDEDDEDDEDDGFANFTAAAPTVEGEATFPVQKPDGHETTDDFTNFEGAAATLTKDTAAEAHSGTVESLEDTSPAEVVPREAAVGECDSDSDDFADFAAAAPEPAVEAAPTNQEEDSDDGFADFATADASAVPHEAVATEATPADGDDDDDWDFAASPPATTSPEDETKPLESVQGQMRDILDGWAKLVESCSEFVAVKELLQAGEDDDNIALADGASDWDAFLALQAGVPDEVRQLAATPAAAESAARCTVPLASLGVTTEAEGNGPPGTVVRETFLAALSNHLQLPATFWSDPASHGTAAAAEAAGIPGMERLRSDDFEGAATPTATTSISQSQDAAVSKPVTVSADADSNTTMGDADWALFETGGAGSSSRSAVAMVPPAPGGLANSFQIAPPPGSRTNAGGVSQGEDVLASALSDFGLSDVGMSDVRFASATPASQAPIPALAAPLTSGVPGTQHSSSGRGSLPQKVRKFIAGLPDLSHMHSNKLVAA